MSLEPATHERITSLVGSDRVVLFMKGNRQAPQCGFSATVVQILDRLVADYTTCDVLSDPEIREGIKIFSSWPTIPQLYVGGEFVGGCDIIQEMFGSGELHDALGLKRPSSQAPTLHVSDAAAGALREVAAQQPPGRELHLSVDARFQNGLYFGPVEDGELRVESNGIAIYLDPLTASRSDGLRLDARSSDQGPAFAIDNPNAPQIRQLEAKEVKRMLDDGERFELIDVRTPEERASAHIEGARLMDDDTRAWLEGLDKETPLVFHCHHGGRSQAAAEHFVALGFRNVANLVGGIDAWSQQVDPSVPRY